MATTGKKKYNKGVDRAKVLLERDNFITDDSMIKKGTSFRKQINLYWKKRAEEKKRYFRRATHRHGDCN